MWESLNPVQSCLSLSPAWTSPQSSAVGVFFLSSSCKISLTQGQFWWPVLKNYVQEFGGVCPVFLTRFEGLKTDSIITAQIVKPAKANNVYNFRL